MDIARVTNQTLQPLAAVRPDEPAAPETEAKAPDFGPAAAVEISEAGRKLQREAPEDAAADDAVGGDLPAGLPEEAPAAPDEAAPDEAAPEGAPRGEDGAAPAGSGGGAAAPPPPYDPPTVATDAADPQTLERSRRQLASSRAALEKKLDAIAQGGGDGGEIAQKLRSGLSKAAAMEARLEKSLQRLAREGAAQETAAPEEQSDAVEDELASSREEPASAISADPAYRG